MMAISKTQYAVLGALTRKPMSGYEVKKMLASSTGYFWTESNGQLYPTLSKLADSGLVTFEEEIDQGKKRKIYTITDAGREVLEEWLFEEVHHYPHRNELLLKLFFGYNVPPEVSIQHIEKHAVMCERLLTKYQDIESRLEIQVKNHERPVYFLLTVKAGLGIIRAELAWCHESINLINKYESKGEK